MTIRRRHATRPHSRASTHTRCPGALWFERCSFRLGRRESNRGQAPRRYVPSTCTNADRRCRPFRPVRAGGTKPLTSGNTLLLFTVVEKHARDSRGLRIRLDARRARKQGHCPRGPSVFVYPSPSPRHVLADSARSPGAPRGIGRRHPVRRRSLGQPAAGAIRSDRPWVALREGVSVHPSRASRRYNVARRPSVRSRPTSTRSGRRLTFS